MGSKKHGKGGNSGEFGRIIDPAAVIEPEVYARDPETKVHVATGRRDPGPLAPLQSHEVFDGSPGNPIFAEKKIVLDKTGVETTVRERVGLSGRRKLLPPKRVIEILRHEVGGAAVDVQTVVTTIREMYRKGTISQEMYDEGREFKAYFDLSSLDALRVPAPDRIPSGGGRETCEPLRVMEARDEVYRRLDILGGEKTAMGKALWHIAGRELSLREMAGGSASQLHFWRYALINGLELLAQHKQRPRKNN